MVEALYVVQFGDFAGATFRNGGVAVLETNRVFGGDSGYYYLGNYEVKDGTISASVQIVKHDPNWRDAFGDNSASFAVILQGKIEGQIISGHMIRTDNPKLSLPVRLTWTAALP